MTSLLGFTASYWYPRLPCLREGVQAVHLWAIRNSTLSEQEGAPSKERRDVASEGGVHRGCSAGVGTELSAEVDALPDRRRELAMPQLEHQSELHPRRRDGLGT